MKGIIEDKPKGCYKSELAHRYCPDLTSKSALKTLREWIKKHPTLGKELEETGYNPKSRRFTPLQVELIYARLGTP